MKLWILQPVDDWNPWYDRAFGFVVRAASEKEARAIAATGAGDETPQVWLDPNQTYCNELSVSGEAALIMRDFAAA